jgi:hypothetical protein
MYIITERRRQFAMTDDLNAVLEQVAAGDLSPAEAASLLDAIGEPPTRASGDQSSAGKTDVPPTTQTADERRHRGQQRGRQSFDELVSNAVRELGDIDISSLTGAKSIGVTVEYAAAMRELDPDAQLGQLIGAHAVGVTASYARQLKDVLGDVDINGLTGAKSTGVSVEYAAAMRELDPEAPLRQIIKARTRGISPQQVATYLERDPSLTLRQVMKAIRAGLSPDQIDDAAGSQPAP